MLDRGPVLINQIVYGEVAYRFSMIEARTGTAAAGEPRSFLTSSSAHTAAVLGLQLLTRDAARYRTYFPTVDVIAPT